MASFDVSVNSASEESFQLECSPCGIDGAVKEAIYFCTDCQEYLCQSCEAQHKRFKGTRNHTTDLCADIKNQEANADAVMCSCRRNDTEMYCEVHEDAFCSDCKIIKHRQCETKSLDEVISKLDTEFEAEVVEFADEEKSRIEELAAERKQSLQRFNIDVEGSKEDIIMFANVLKNQIDRLKDNALEDLRTKAERHTENIDQHMNACETALKTLSAEYNDHKKLLNKRKSKKQKFVSQLKLKQTLRDLDALVTDIKKETYEPKVIFERNQTLVSDNGVLGAVKSNLHSDFRRFSADMTVISSRRVDVKLPLDKNTPWIASSVFLPNDDVILCDRNNDSIKHFNSDFTFLNSIQVPGKARFCCLFDDNELLVSLSNKNQVQRYRILPSLSLKGTIHMDIKCKGIHAFGKDIYVLCHDNPNKEIRIIDENGSLKMQISLNENDTASFLCPYYLTISELGDIFVSECRNDGKFAQIRCYSHDGAHTYTFSSTDLIGTGGMLVANGGRLLACFCLSNGIKVISKDGSSFGDFFQSDVDMFEKPYTINYRKRDRTLIVGYRDNSNIMVYKLQ